MKAEKVIGIAACAFACVTSSAFANTTNGWFGVTADTAIRASNCETNGAAVTVENSKIKIEDATLVIDGFANAPTSDGIVKISATALLTPNSASDLDSAVTEGAKAGFAVAVDNNNVTNFYGYAGSSWHVLSGVTPGDGDTTFSMILNYRDGNVSFYVGDTLLISEGSLTLAGTGLNAIDASGSGSITSITGAYEVAVAAYGDKKYGSIAEASDAAKAAIPEVDPTTVVEVVDSNGTPQGVGVVAANGLSKIVCEALGLPMNDEDANIAVAPKPVDTDEDEITLAVNLPINAEPDAVGFVINGEGTVYNAGEIKIPLTAGTYTITPVLK
jgi:hypothetical protein